MHDMIALLFAAPFAIVSVGLSLWFVCRSASKPSARDSYDDPDTWGRQ